MRNFSKVAVAIATALTGSAAFALPPTTAFQVVLNVGGSSAFRDSFKSLLPTYCSDTLDTFQTQSGGPDFKAYTCTLNAAAGSTLSGKTAVVYYRSEGGSVWGAITAAKVQANGTQINRLDITAASCTGPVANVYTCPVTGYDLTTDVTVAGLVKDALGLGVSDVEPAMFVGANRPSVPVATAAPANFTKIIGQAFGIYVNSGLAVTNLSKQTVGSILSGAVSDWSLIPNATGTGFVTATPTPIVVCRRDVGSGTQAQADVYFNGTNCSPAAVPFVATSFINNSTGAELNCISTNAGAIGFANLQSSLPSGTTLVNLDGVTPSRVNAANGTYGDWFELGVTRPTTFPAGVLSLGNTLATTLVNGVKAASTIPASPNNSIFALPGGSNVIALPVDANHPVSIGSRSGNSCRNPVNQNG